MRAKCTPASSPNGSTPLCAAPSACMRSRTARTAVTPEAGTVAWIVNATWCGMASVPRVAQREPRRTPAPQPDHSELQPRADDPGLVAHHARDEGGTRVVEDGARLAVHPAVAGTDRRP